MLQDLRYAVRMLCRSPGFTVVAVLTLALGIGANTAVFSLLNAALLRPAPGTDPGQLVWITGNTGPRGYRSLSYQEVLDHGRQDSVFSGVMAWQDMGLVLSHPGEPERISALLVTPDYFQVLGQRLEIGQPLPTAAPADPAVVLAHGLWRRRFAQDANVVGKTITLSGRVFTVVGVAPRGFNGIDLGEGTDVFLSFDAAGRAWPGVAANMATRNSWWVRAVGRLRPGVTEAMARLRVEAEGARLATAYPREMRGTGASIARLAGGMDPGNRREAVPVFVLLMAVPALVLLIACANLANLLLQRAAARQREIVVRRALGATRARLVRQLVAENLLLAAVAGAAGVLASFWIADVVAALGHVPEAVTSIMRPDARVLGFALTVAVTTGLVFGLVPALAATRPRLTAMTGDAAAGTRFSRSRLVAAFLVAQVAVSLVLLVTAGLFLRSLDKATRVDPGFTARNGVIASMDLAVEGYDLARRGEFYRAMLERVTALPGVTAASIASDLPLHGRTFGTYVTPQGAADERGSVGIGVAAVWPGYLGTMGITLRAGRDVADGDNAAAPKVALINEALARRLWPGRSPIGQRMHLGGLRDSIVEVVGVTADVKHRSLTEDPRPFVFVPERQQPDYAPDMTLVVRTSGEPMLVVPALRQAVRELDAAVALYGIRPLDQLVSDGLGKERAASALLGAFGLLALLLAMVGLYGVVAYAVTQRTREIGIRMALGARQAVVLGMMVGDGVRLAVIGIVIGLALAVAVTRVIQRFLYGITATDVPTFVAVALVLALIAAFASWVPARRAARVDPTVALRAE
jgi:predicted permease